MNSETLADTPNNWGTEGIDVLTIGHALVDVLAGADDSTLEAEGLPKGSMNLIDALRADSLYDSMGPGSETSGGSAANTATGVVACGSSAAFVGVVADDQLGEIFAHDLRSAGVLYRTPPRNDVGPTGRCLVLVTPDGERTMSTFLGAGANVGPAVMDTEFVEAARITYVEGYCLDTEYTLETLKHLADHVHEAGGQFSITLSDLFCVDRHRDLFLELLEGSVDICFGNEEEALALFETRDREVAYLELEKRCKIAAVTLSERGSILLSEGQRAEVPAVKANVVDTTGAGDFYAAGVLSGLAKGWPLERCGRMGSRAAGAVISQMGARLSRPIASV